MQVIIYKCYVNNLKTVVVKNILNSPDIFGKLDFSPESPDNLSKLAKKQLSGRFAKYSKCCCPLQFSSKFEGKCRSSIGVERLWN